MSSEFVIIGGAGFIGRNLAKRLLETVADARIILVDLKDPHLPGCEYHHWDVRTLNYGTLAELRPEWIFNFAAIHREPGHEPEEYFDTNVPAARNVCEFARVTGCKKIYYTSSIAVYGPTKGPTSEKTQQYPTTPYGISKWVGEHIHQEWQAEAADRRLIICRPGVVYGPGETGNIPRMVRAIKKGFFAFPGKKSIVKSYAYIDGLIESMMFTCGFEIEQQSKRSLPARFVYNYVEYPSEPLGELVRHVSEELKVRNRTLSIPLAILVPTARIAHTLSGGRIGIHPTRVKKAATPTHIIPQALNDAGFEFHFPFAESLVHWRKLAPEDFEVGRRRTAPPTAKPAVGNTAQEATAGTAETISPFNILQIDLATHSKTENRNTKPISIND